jgi:hypothetical protein
MTAILLGPFYLAANRSVHSTAQPNAVNNTLANSFRFHDRPRSALRHRCKVMTLTPSVRNFALQFALVAKSFACASFVAISALECLFFLAIGPLVRRRISVSAIHNEVEV